MANYKFVRRGESPPLCFSPFLGEKIPSPKRGGIKGGVVFAEQLQKLLILLNKNMKEQSEMQELRRERLCFYFFIAPVYVKVFQLPVPIR